MSLTGVALTEIVSLPLPDSTFTTSTPWKLMPPGMVVFAAPPVPGTTMLAVPRPKPVMLLVVTVPLVAPLRPEASTVMVSVAWPSSPVVVSLSGGAGFSVGSMTATFSVRSWVPTPPSTTTGPWMAPSVCGPAGKTRSYIAAGSGV